MIPKYANLASSREIKEKSKQYFWCLQTEEQYQKCPFKLSEIVQKAKSSVERQ